MEQKVDNLVRNGNIGHAAIGSHYYTFEIGGSVKVASPGILPLYNQAFELLPMRIGDFDIIPRGDQNIYPLEMKEILDGSGMQAEQIRKKVNLLWGQGPFLYKEDIVETAPGESKMIRNPVKNTEITAWLKSWKHIEYLHKIAEDLRAMNGYYDKKRINLNARIGKPKKINSIHYVPYEDCALEWYDVNTQECQAIIVGDYVRPWVSGLTRFPIWDPTKPFKYPVSMSYNRLAQFGHSKQYTRSSFHGSQDWLKAHNTVARIVYMFNLNLAALKVHIKIPTLVWNAKLNELKEKYAKTGTAMPDSIIEEEKDKYIAAIVATVSGADQTGKLLVTDKVYDPDSNTMVGVEVEAIDLKIKEYIDAQINIAKQAAYEASASNGLDPALSNLSRDGNLPSGSDKLYAYKVFLLTDIAIAEEILYRSINEAIEINWPDSEIKIGSYRETIITEQQTSPKDRIKNNDAGNAN